MNKRTIFRMLNKAAEKFTDHNYLSQKCENGWDRTSFKDAKNKSLQLASALVELGIKYEDKLAILSEAKTDWVVSEFAVLYAGGISVPLSIKLLPEEIPFRVNHSDARLLIISENTLEKVIPHWDKYENKDLKLVVLDRPSKKFYDQCKKYNFNEKKLLFVDDLYELGSINYGNNLRNFSSWVENKLS